MGYSFNPVVWFVCRLCRRAFQDMEKLKNHKLEFHLGECLKTKCIVFEEKCYEEEFCFHLQAQCSPQNQNHRPRNGHSQSSIRNSPNPYVQLTRLTSEESEHLKGVDATEFHDKKSDSFAGGFSRKQRITRSSKYPSFSNVVVNNVDHDGDDNASLLAKKGRYQFRKQPNDPTISNSESSCQINQSHLNHDGKKLELELENEQFIVASILSNSDGSGNVRFESATLPNAIDALLTNSQTSVAITNLKTLVTSTTTSHSSFVQPQLELSSTQNVVEPQVRNYPRIQDAQQNYHNSSTEFSEEILTDSEMKSELITYENQNHVPQIWLADPKKLIQYPDDDISNNEPGDDAGDYYESLHSEPEPFEPIVGIQTEAPQENLVQELGQCSSSQLVQGQDQTLGIQPVAVENIVLLDPPPSSPFLTASPSNPVTCKLCLTTLVSDLTLQNHAQNCWHHNKDHHVYCVTCYVQFSTPRNLNNHLIEKHFSGASGVNDRSSAEIVCLDFEDESSNKDNDSDLPLFVWIQKRKYHFPDHIVLDPEPSRNPNLWYSVTCRLCEKILNSPAMVKSHVKICWAYNKQKHCYCVSCERKFKFPSMFRSHQIKGQPKCREEKLPPSMCKECKHYFPTHELLSYHKKSLRDFYQHMVEAEEQKLSKILAIRKKKNRNNFEKSKLLYP